MWSEEDGVASVRGGNKPAREGHRLKGGGTANLKAVEEEGIHGLHFIVQTQDLLLLKCDREHPAEEAETVWVIQSYLHTNSKCSKVWESLIPLLKQVGSSRGSTQSHLPSPQPQIQKRRRKDTRNRLVNKWHTPKMSWDSPYTRGWAEEKEGHADLQQ